MANRSEKGRITLLSLSIPIVIEQVLRSLMGTINTFMLSRVSDDASAAAGVANQALNVVIMAATMLAFRHRSGHQPVFGRRGKRSAPRGSP